MTLILPRNDRSRPPAILQAAERVGVRPGRNWILRLGTGDVLQRAVFYVLEGQQPAWVVKFSRVQGYDRSFVDDAAGLALAQTSGGPVADHAPSHLGQFDVDGLTASVETAAVGTQLVHLLRRRPWQLLDEIADWIVRVGRHTARSPQLLEPERARLRALVVETGGPLGVPEDVVDRVPETPSVLQHNDLGTWNIISDGRSFTAVDWEAARHSGLPLWDLFYFAADVFAHIDGPADVSTRIERTLRVFAGESAHSPRLFRWIRAAATALDVPNSALGALATLCWLHHGQSPARREMDLRGAAHAPLGHHPLLAPAWLGHPGLGVSWAALNG
ncbi:phosphotransferase [Geodermatophilus sabuli]|uniref:phosphotransferase n=1 Tax=Geodermatophilus sabuli TaxID=1564158 RepID=UPI00117A14CC|nr:phosphotransferase [Geodermatophilus sabuli]